MNLDAQSLPRPMRSAATAGLAMVRRSGLGVLVILVVEFGFGMYVNLYLTVPRADHGRGLGTAIANGPAMLSVHAVTGLLLGRGQWPCWCKPSERATWPSSSRRRQACSRSPLPR